MALSEFRYNKKRKHFSYIFGKKGNKRKNILLSSKSQRKEKKKKGKYKIYDNVKLTINPNPNNNESSYLINKIYLDDNTSFGNVKSNWKFHPYDRLKVKKIKKSKWK